MKSNLSATIILLSIFHGYAMDASTQGIHGKIDTLILTKKIDKAEKIALNAYTMHPKEPEAICALACVYRNKALKSANGIKSDAVEIRENQTADAGAPAYCASLRLYAGEKVSFDMNKYKKAETLYEKILKINPTYEKAYGNLLHDYVFMVDSGKLFPLVDRFISNMPDDEMKRNTLIDLASMLAKNKDVETKTVIRLYEKIVRAYPGYLYAISDLAAMYQRQGETKQAIEFFKEAYEMDKKDKITLTHYVRALIFNEDFTQAYDLAKRLAEMDTLSYYLAGMLGYLLDKKHLGYFEKLAKIQKKTAQEPEKDFWYAYAMEYETIGKIDKKGRLDFFQKQLDVFNHAGMQSEAIVAGNIICKLEPTGFALSILGSIYYTNLNLEMTIKYLNLMNERRKNDPTIGSEYDILSNYAGIYLAKDKFQEAHVYLLKMQGMKKKDARLNHYLGIYSLGLGKKNEAIAYFKKNTRMNGKKETEWIHRSLRELKKLCVIK